MTPASFRNIVWAHYKKQGRHDLPWRKNNDLYRILVSEIMLQQTQVDRVIPLYKAFIKKFPTIKKLATAPLAEVLKSWQGLGYNRRAKMLHSATKVLSEIPRSNLKNLAPRFDLGISELEKLPGVGPYTVRALSAFVYNRDVVVIETNIRTVIIHHFFPKKKKVSDAEIEKILLQVLPKGKSREWYSALMDYGAYLKRSGISHNVRTSVYAKQSRFAGSSREVRGSILRTLSKGSVSVKTLSGLFDTLRKSQVEKALADLIREGLIQKNNERFSLVD